MALPGKILNEDLNANLGGELPSKFVNEFNRLQTHAESLETQLEDIVNSKSWKITRPLRVGKLILNYLRATLSFSQTALTSEKLEDLVIIESQLTVSGAKPSIYLKSATGWRPAGWVEFRAGQSRSLPDFKLYIDDGNGFSEDLVVTLRLSDTTPTLVKLPKLVRQLRLDPITTKPFQFDGIFARTKWTWPLLWRVAGLAAQKGKSKFAYFRELISCYLKGGQPLLSRKLLGWNLSRVDFNQAYERWIKLYDTISNSQRSQMRKEIESWQTPPLISILMPVYNTNPRWLRRALDSVRGQIYTNWELCMVDDASTRPEVSSILSSYSKIDSRIRVRVRSENGHISAASNDALDMAKGQYIALMDHDDELSEHALYHIVVAILGCPEAELIFSDEDRITAQGKRRDPYFKGGYNPELMLSQNLISHLGVYRTSIAKSINGFRLGLEGSQDWDFALRFCDKISPDKIVHVPHVLYHWRMVPGTVSFNTETKLDALSAAEIAVSDHLKRTNVAATVKADPTFGVRVELAIPSSVNRSITVLAFNGGPDVVATIEEQAAEVLGDVRWVKGRTLAQAINALNEAQNRPDYIIYFGANVSQVDPGAIQALLSAVCLDGVGAVGALSMDKSNRIVQSGLIEFSHGNMLRAFEGLPATSNAYFALAHRLRQVSLIDSCMLVIRTSEILSVSLEDSDLDSGAVSKLCQALSDNGTRVLIEPRARCMVEALAGDSVHRKITNGNSKPDPFYSPSLSQIDGGYFLNFDL